MTNRMGRNPFASSPARVPQTTPPHTPSPRPMAEKPSVPFTAGWAGLTRDLTSTVGYIVMGLGASILVAFHRSWIVGTSHR